MADESMADESAQRHADALVAAREYYRLSRESLDIYFKPDRACAQALLGILRLQIAHIEDR